MTAVFGKLQGQTLELGDGLNIIQAPNETGKSTWCAFLLSMLYGVNSRERERAGHVPDKVRYAPWSGAPMSGRLDCRVDGQELTLLRSTRRQANPMGEFRAVYTGTGEPVSGLTGQVCGEALLGVTREVYERSAFIRQAGLPIRQEASLERRIGSLIASGEEEVSCSEAASALKKQLNRRRHNQTGQIPALEAQLQETEHRLARLESLEARLAEAMDRADNLSAREAETAAQLARQEQWDAAQQRQALQQAQDRAETARQRALALNRQLEDGAVPELEAIARLRGSIANLEMSRRTLDRARDQRDQAAEAQLLAGDAVRKHRFAGLTPEQAEANPPDLPPRPRLSLWMVLLALALGLGLCAAVYAAQKSLPPAAGSGGGAGGLLLLGFSLLTARKQRRWEAQAAGLRQRHSQDLEIYAGLYRAAEAARSEAAAKSAAFDSLNSTLAAAGDEILSEVRRFAPYVRDLHAADEALRSGAARRKELAAAEAAAREAQMRWELLARQAPDAAVSAGEPGAPPPPSPPEQSREDLTAGLERIRIELAAARSEADLLTGQCQALGEPAVLRSDAEHTREELACLEQEYDALQLALDTLEEANAALQARFSPSLGSRTAEIFQELTGERYSGVVLDRSLHLSVEPAGDPLSRDAAFLSAGAADQLYLAVRLAICQLVLPAEDPAPLVLDDALANFDGARCTAALKWLRREAEGRQILLFTCHSREAEFFAGDPSVRVQQLTGTL